MKLISIALSELGRVRRNNEDNLYLNAPVRLPGENASTFKRTLSVETHAKLFAVSDGMGGEAMGEQASYLSVAGLPEIEARLIEDPNLSFAKLIPDYLNQVNEKLCQMIRSNHGRRMGSTFSALYLENNYAYTINIGDSPIFLFRGSEHRQLTINHTSAQRLFELGIIDEETLRTHPERHRLTQHLGLFPEECRLRASISGRIPLHEGDIFMLCSDGVTEMLSLHTITDILQSPMPFLQKAEAIMQAAMEAGGKDNASLILLRVSDLDTHAQHREDQSGELEGEDLSNITINRTEYERAIADVAAMPAYRAIEDSTIRMPGEIRPERRAAGMQVGISAEDQRRFEEMKEAARQRQNALHADQLNASAGGRRTRITQRITNQQSPEEAREALLARKSRNSGRKHGAASVGRSLLRALLIFVLSAGLSFAALYVLSKMV